jgi:quercetin dioxygenase-like cupin family protein
MSHFEITEPAAYLVDTSDIKRSEVMGPMVEYLTPLREGEPCVMRGTIPPGVSGPLHSHADPETFLMVSGEVEGLRQAAGSSEWIAIRPGDVFHVPGGAKHAFRNRKNVPATMVIVSTDRIGRFFQEVGSPVVPGRQPAPPTPEAIQHFLETSARYGYWNATPEENERVGITLPGG